MDIDSCPIGGFIPERVMEILNIESEKYMVSMLLPIGYKAQEAHPKLRLAFNDVVEFID